jgi:predicted nucleotidyltransferase
MRKNTFLDALMPPTRQGVLAATLLQSGKSWYLSELAEHIGTRVSSLQREIEALVHAGILERHVDGRRTYVKADENSPIFPELRRLMEKTSGVIPLLIEEAARFKKNKIKWAFVYGSVARGEENAASDVDVMLIGEVTTMEIVPVFRRVEKVVGRPINETVFSERDFINSLKKKSHFLRTVMRGDKIMLKGSEDELDAVARNAQSA